MMEWQYLVVLAIFFGFSILSIIMKTWLKSSIEKDLQARYDRQLEQLRAELRLAEEHYKSTLKLQEADKALLRNTVLSGANQRQSLVDKRRIEVIESTWSAMIGMLPLKGICHTLSNFAFEGAVEMSAGDKKAQDFFKQIFDKSLADPPTKSLGLEQLFLTPLAWGYFSTYNQMMWSGYTRAKILTIGLKGAADALDFKPLKAALIAALPAHKDFIEMNEIGQLYCLLDLLEGKLLEELRSILEGQAIDAARAEHASKMLSALASLEQRSADINKRTEIPDSIIGIELRR